MTGSDAKKTSQSHHRYARAKCTQVILEREKNKFVRSERTFEIKGEVNAW
jgi:hypothetical protein